MENVGSRIYGKLPESKGFQILTNIHAFHHVHKYMHLLPYEDKIYSHLLANTFGVHRIKRKFVMCFHRIT